MFKETIASFWTRSVRVLAGLYPGLKWVARVTGALLLALVATYIANSLLTGSWRVELKVVQPLLRLCLRYPIPVAVGFILVIVLAIGVRAGHIREKTQETLRGAFRIYKTAKQLKLEDLQAYQERPCFGYLPRKLVDETDVEEIDVTVPREYAEEDLVRLLGDGQGFIIVDHLYAGKTLTLFNVLKKMHGYVVVSPEVTRPIPSNEVFRLLRGHKVVISLDDLAVYAHRGYDLREFRRRVALGTKGHYGVAAACRDGADLTVVVAGCGNPVTYFVEETLRLRLRFRLLTVDERRDLAKMARRDLNQFEPRLHRHPGDITLWEQTAVMANRFRLLPEPGKDVLRAMKLLDAYGVPVATPRVHAGLMAVSSRRLSPIQTEGILRTLWERGFLVEQPSGSKAYPHFGHLAHAVSYQEGREPEDDLRDKLVNSLKALQDAEALVYMGDTLGRRGELLDAVQVLDAALRVDPRHAEAHFRRGYSLARLGRLEEALEANGRALSFRPRFAEAHNNRGYILSLQGEFEDALVSLQKALEIWPEYDDAHVNRAIVLARLAQFEEAIEEFNVALGLKPESHYAHLNLGITLSRQDAFEEALTAFDHALRLRPDYPEAHLNRGITLARMKRFDEALEAQERAVDLRPGYAEAYMHLGQTLANMQRYDEAIERLNRATELRQDYAMAYLNRARTLSHMGPEHREAASRDWERALALGVDLPLKNIAIGVSLSRQTRYQQAIEIFDRLIDLYPRYPEAHLNRGITLARMERFDEALADFARALELRTECPEAHLNRGQTLARMERFDEALADFARALELRTEYPEAHYESGRTLAMQGHYDQALAAFDRAINLQPGYAEAHCDRGSALANLGHHDEALRAVETAIALRPEFPEAHCAYGYVLTTIRGFDRSRLRRALAAYDEAVRLRPTYPEAHRERGFILAQLGQDEVALEAYDQAIQLRPQFPEALLGKARALCFLARKDAYRFPPRQSFREAIELLEQAKAIDPKYIARALTKDRHAFTQLKGHRDCSARFRSLIWDQEDPG